MWQFFRYSVNMLCTSWETNTQFDKINLLYQENVCELYIFPKLALKGRELIVFKLLMPTPKKAKNNL